VTSRSLVQRSPTDFGVCVYVCVSVIECYQVQRSPRAPTVNRKTDVRLRKKKDDV
jgi:hypothetical protein